MFGIVKRLNLIIAIAKDIQNVVRIVEGRTKPAIPHRVVGDADLPVRRVSQKGQPMVVASVKFYADDYTRLKEWLKTQDMTYANLVRSALKEWFVTHGVTDGHEY